MNDQEYNDEPVRHPEIGNLTDEEISDGFYKLISQTELMSKTERDRSGVTEANRKKKKEERLWNAYINLEEAIDRVLKHTTDKKAEKREMLRRTRAYLKVAPNISDAAGRAWKYQL